MEWPKVYVNIITYDRPKEIRKTIDALIKHLKYKGELLWNLADDGTEDPLYLVKIKQQYPQLKFTCTVTDRKGWGKNTNKSMVFCWAKTPYLYLNEDDYAPKKNIDLTSGIAILEANRNLGLIRYDGVEGHYLDLQLREVKTQIGMISCLAIMHSSPHLNLYSHRPHLKHRRFHDKYGMYREDMPLGKTEENFAHRVRDKYQLFPKIALLKDGIARAYDHHGHSRQRTPTDPNYKPKG